MMNAEQLEALCDWLESEEACHIREEGGSSTWTCDGTLRFTEQWLTAHGLSTDVNIPLIFASCAHCDCEVGLNSRETGWPPQREFVDMVLKVYAPADRAIVLMAYQAGGGEAL